MSATDKSPEVVETVQRDSFEPSHSNDAPPQKQHYTYDAEARRHRLDGGVKLRDALMILCAGFALISDGYQNNVMSMLLSLIHI